MPATLLHLTLINILVTASALILYYVLVPYFVKPKVPLPPGPPGEFLLGHYRIVPVNEAFKWYAKWGKEYKSDVLFFKTFGTKWIVLNSLKSAVELLDKCGSKYADRPRFVLFEEMGWSPTLTWLRWGPKMRLHRRVLQSPFARSKMGQYAGLQRREALICCKGFIDDPVNWTTAMRRFGVAIVLNISYGLEVDGPSSRWIKLAEESSNAIGKSGAPASSIMDRFPATRYLPAWLPFLERLRYARKWRWAIQSITSLPFEASIKNMKQNLDRKCFAHNQLATYADNVEKGLPNEFDLEDIKGAAATITIAGNDTTSASVMLLVLYLMQNQDTQRKGQEEVDRVVGKDRLPTWDDIPNLPYMNLILQETYRMNPLSPLGIPHASIADNVYEGMFIPKGTIVYPNVWAMHHDDSVYADPYRFWPERYLPREKGGNGEPFPVGNFGFGRRICIGRNLAENSLLIQLATMLATVNIDWPPGPDGTPTPFEPEWSFRGQAIVLPFPASFTSRSKAVEGMLDEEVRRI
ncbi:O-methylsterigmatocystin oxidoreductase [Phialemonium atrogriseum]|uniref:O-methylsterigmatocystin oxidoreductase n=1 Tax=Phialemonium atrogriseum TaxID=1093897 RepID=A0AAJ0C1Y4_9PEZI|nr:O-methylsterigmatocystin oxidoreductase [Phialemonium atrogriseum]KAK1767239.1 O-methylsterigmatocystin oxidoreductase [Phialemonium atrogriseum]